MFLDSEILEALGSQLKRLLAWNKPGPQAVVVEYGYFQGPLKNPIAAGECYQKASTKTSQELQVPLWYMHRHQGQDVVPRLRPSICALCI